MTTQFITRRLLIISLLAVLTAANAFAQTTTAFNFQGRLNDGTNAANGRYDLQFRLYDALTGGSPIGTVVSRANTTFVNGIFSVTLDFGATAFNNPDSVFMEIAIRPNGSPNAYTILGQRQQLTAVPFAVRATNAENAQNAVNATNAANAANATNAVTAQNANSLGGIAPTGWTRLNSPNNGDLITTGRLQITGNATQPSTSTGLVKAMLEVQYDVIIRCYNGVTNNSSGNCGFTATEPLGLGSGVSRINLGFPVSSRFFSVTAKYNSAGLQNQPHNYGANYRIFDSTSVEVFTFAAGEADDTHDATFIIIVY